MKDLSITILDSLSDGILLLDDQRLITAINSAALRLIGMAKEQSLSFPIEAILDLPVEIFDPTDILPHLHLPVRLKDPRETRIEGDLTLHAIAGGWLLVLREIGQRHKNLELLERQRFLETILSNTPNHFLVLDQHRHLLYANNSLLQLTGLAASNWNTFDWLALGVSSEESQNLDELLREALLSCRPTWGEIVLTNSNGQFEHEVIFTPLETSSNPNILIIVTLADVSIHHKMEEELRQSRDHFRRLLTGIPDPMVTIDHQGLISHVSARFLDLIQARSEKEVVGTEALDWVSPQDRLRAQMNMDLILSGYGDLAEQESLYTFLRKDSQKFIGDINAAPYRPTSNEPDGLIATIRDASSHENERTELNRANEMLLRSNEELETQNFMVNTLSEMGRALLACDSIDAACQILANTTANLFRGQAGAIFLKDPAAEPFKLISAWGENPSLEGDINDRCCPALQSKSNRFFCIPALHRKQVPQKGGGPGGVQGPQVCFPLIVRDEILGVFQLHGNLQQVPDTWMQIAGSMADKFALTIANLRLRDSLRIQAIRDPLTGLYNRRHMEESLQRELARARRHNHPVGIIMLDLDFFKLFNDTYLHDGGDALLRRLGRFFLNHTRGEDIACRYGGEEFTLILPETTLDESYARADELRKQIGQIRLVHRGVHLHRVTISVGVSCYPLHGQNAEDLLRAADAALYRSKNNGRNRTTMAEIVP